MEIYWLPLLTGVGKLRNSNKNFIFITVTVTNGGDALISEILSLLIESSIFLDKEAC